MQPLRLGRVKLLYDNPKRPAQRPSKQRKPNPADENDDDDDDEGEGGGREEEEEAKRGPAEGGEGEYEVEEILDRCDFGAGSVFYLVKWKFWHAKYNTWEPAAHLDCEECVRRYVAAVEDGQYLNGCIDRYLRLLVHPSREKLESHMQALQSEGRALRVRTEQQLRGAVVSVLKAAGEERKRALVHRLKQDLLLKYLYVRRARQATALGEWAEEMNGASGDAVPLFVENDFDLEGPPEFLYVNEYIPGQGVVIPNDPPLGCQCKTCSGRFKCCSPMAEFKFAYTSQGTLQVPFDTPIYECNSKCRCDASCANRVVQAGRRVQLCIFRTANGCGWGVKTLQSIRKGAFVCCYVGEVIRNEEAEVRAERYQVKEHTYLFDMDYNGSNYNYTVDGTVYGNVSRFINHSCSPNLTVCFVWVNCLDPSLPQLAFFALRHIQAGDELTIDYIGDSIKVDTTARRTKPCKCGAAECKKFIL